jgi:hypothetical protein
MKRFRLLNVLLVVLIALATWRTIAVWRRGVPEIPDRMGTAPPSGETLPPAARKPPLQQVVSVIAENDLFDASRKPPADAAAPAPEQTPPPPPTLKLAGVIVVGTQREVVFTDTAKGNKQIRMREGEEISGYKVREITRENVHLTTGTGEEVTLSLLIDTTAKRGSSAFGLGGAPTPRAATARVAPAGRRGAEPPPEAGAFGPPGVASGAAAQEDARERAQRARERLKKLRAEAARR